MSSFARTILVLAGAMVCVCVSSPAQPAATITPPAPVKSPVALFRELLAMNPVQRRDAIALRPPDTQNRILEKLNEYELYPPELRDLRLRETELRWYLRPLMDEPRTNRGALLALIPQELRGQVEERLQTWDLLPEPLQDQLKNNDLIASYFAQIRWATPQERDAILATIPADRRAELEKGLDHWKDMPENERQKSLAAFNKWFELTPEQKEKTLDTVSDDERREMEQTLSSYAKLTLAQRALCIKSFEKFAGMSIAERQQFLKNAERWREMTPEEREKWRQLVSVAPILPPLIFSHPNPARTLAPHAPTVATN
jgi:hypothetical protein